MMAIKDKFNKVIGKKDPDVTYQLRLKKSERVNWETIAKDNGFNSTAGLIKFLVKKAEKEPSKMFG